jgi:uncharacterized protein (TIGR00725 family)
MFHIIGVMGPGEGATPDDEQNAYELGQLIAQQNWVLLTGGRNAGVMDAACRGAKQAGGLTLGILPSRDRTTLSSAVDIPIITDMGNARNAINVLSSDVVIACGFGAGTASEIALALKARKPVILLNPNQQTQAFWMNLASGNLFIAKTPIEAIEISQSILKEKA